MVPQLWPKIVSANQIAVLFDHQYIWNKPLYILDFLHGDIYLGKVASETDTSGWVWPALPLVFFFFLLGIVSRKEHPKLPLLIECGQVHLLFSQITGFCDQQYLRKELIYTLDFLQGNNHQGRVTSETTTFG